MKARSDSIKQALAKRHLQDFFMTEVKNGATHTSNELLKMDAMAIKKSWAHPCITGYEIKVDRSDFTRDNKWHGYMAYCNQFSFVCPTGLIQPEELSTEVGLIYFNPERGSFLTKRKALYRQIEVPSSLLYYIIMNRLENDRHPFFSDQRDFIEAYMIDREDRKELGRRFGLKVSGELAELRELVKSMKRKEERDQEDVRQFSEVCTILKNYGINIYRWNDWQDDLRTALAGSGMNPKVIAEAERLATQAEKLLKLLNPEMEVSHA